MWLLKYYRGFQPYAHFGTWKKSFYMKFVLVGLYCGLLLMLIPPLTRTQAKNRGSGNRVSDFRVSGGPPVSSLEKNCRKIYQLYVWNNYPDPVKQLTYKRYVFVRRYWCFYDNFKQMNIFLPWNWKFEFWWFLRLP